MSKKIFIQKKGIELVCSILMGAFMAMIFLACGVKGDPRPPLEPTFVGSGQQDFQKRKDEFEKRNATQPVLEKKNDTDQVKGL